MEQTEVYDVVLIGSGLSALWLATELLRATKAKVAVVEQYKALGGRVATFHTDLKGVGPLQWEGGAARISSRHTHVLELVRRYKLHWIPIPHKTTYKDTYTSEPRPDTFELGIPAMLQPLLQLSPTILATHTVRSLLIKLHGFKVAEEYLLEFPYRAEIDVLRADQALAMFTNEFSKQAEYGIVAEGFSAVVDGLEKEFKKLGGTVLTHYEFVGATQESRKDLVTVRCLVGPPSEGTSRSTVSLQGRRLVLAIPPAALARIPQFAKWPLLERLRMEPLLRFYGVFPLGADGKAWFEGLDGTLVTSTPIRFVIPASAKKGIIQISYTDSQDTEHWTRILEKEGADAAGAAMIEELEKLLGLKIPKPLMVKAHHWKEGAAYWLPGEYSAAEASREAALRPFPELPAVHVCGDSYSLRQAWVEGALEHAALLLPVLQRSLKK